MKNSSAVCLSPDGAIAQTASRDCRTTARASSANLKLLAPLRAGDDSVLSELVRRYHGPLLRLALVFLPSEALAEEVVQDTWTAVVEGLTSFASRMSECFSTVRARSCGGPWRSTWLERRRRAQVCRAN